MSAYWRLFVSVCLLIYAIISVRSPSWVRACCVLGAVSWLAWDYWMRRRARAAQDESGDNRRPLISIVLMLKQARYLDEAILAHCASRAWGVEVRPAERGSHDGDAFFVAGASPLSLIKGPEGIFIVHNHDRPYTDKVEEMADTIPELRLREAFKQHRSWMSVDLLHPLPEADLMATYRAIGRLVAELIDDNCLTVYGPESAKMVVYSPELEEQLRGDEPLTALNYFPSPPVIEIREDDPEMKAAAAEARRRWPEFVTAFESREPDDIFSVKARVSDGTNSEFIWISVTALENDRIIGQLGNEPVALGGMKEGDLVRTTAGELNDWMYLRSDKKPVGGFTVHVLTRRMGAKG